MTGLLRDDQPLFDQIHHLVTRQLEGTLSPAEAARLEELVCEDPQARRIFAAYMIESFGLHWWSGPATGRQPTAALPVADAPPRRALSPLREVLHFVNQPLVFSLMFAAAFLFASLVVLRVARMPGPATDPRAVPSGAAGSHVVATLISAADCHWEDGRARQPGMKLTAGTLNLHAGYAEVQFGQGATVALTGPTTLRLESDQAGYLERGQLVAVVPRRARGFCIGTPTSLVTDLGTEFGVRVGDDGETEVEVFAGSVQIDAARAERRLATGEAVRIARASVAGGSAAAVLHNLPPAQRSPFLRPLGIGRGTGEVRLRLAAQRDAYVQPQSQLTGQLPVLQVKYDKHQILFSRKTYMRFDLSALPGQIAAARLRLTLARQDGLHTDAAPQQTWQFEIYGLTDPTLADWAEAALNWTDAPGNAADHAFQLDPARTTSEPLARFDIFGAGQPGQTVEVGSEALTQFLNEHAGQPVTLILVRTTSAQGEDRVVHQFASREHDDLPGPMLEFRYAAQPAM